MGAIIEAIAVTDESTECGNSTERAIAACKAALNQAARDPGEVGVLINCGVYPDGFVVEPAMASYIQKGIDANRFGSVTNCDASTFSFDLNHGGCGFVTAASVIDGFLSDGTTPLGLLVASDPTSDEAQPENYPFAGAAAAVVLRAGGDGEGFVGFHARDGDSPGTSFESFAVPRKGSDGEPKGSARDGYKLLIREQDGFAAECADLATRAVLEYLDREEIADLDLVLTSEYPVEFGARLQESLSLTPDQLVSVPSPSHPHHTAGLAISLHQSIRSGQFATANRILFVAVGAGPSVVLALYVKSAQNNDRLSSSATT
jgi:3-oxoacyl-[acyl-carrier-protein] synthase III